MPSHELSKKTIKRRETWLAKLVSASGRFMDDSALLESALANEIREEGTGALLDHLRVCGTIPESFSLDSTQEKLYSKYTDALLAVAFRQMGMKALVIRERADAADVESVAEKFSLVADAKAFRLSRTAKNQKDFKLQAMDGWKRGKPHALVVSPIYQLPSASSQIYQQAAARNVCLLSYTHIALLVGLAAVAQSAAQHLLHRMLVSIETLNPTKSASAYWQVVNETMLKFNRSIPALWREEKVQTLNALRYAKEEALTTLSRERERIMRLSHQEALSELVKRHNLEGRVRAVRAVADNGLMDV